MPIELVDAATEQETELIELEMQPNPQRQKVGRPKKKQRIRRANSPASSKETENRSSNRTEYFREYRQISRATSSSEELSQIQERDTLAHRQKYQMNRNPVTAETNLDTVIEQLYASAQREAFDLPSGDAVDLQYWTEKLSNEFVSDTDITKCMTGFQKDTELKLPDSNGLLTRKQCASCGLMDLCGESESSHVKHIARHLRWVTANLSDLQCLRLNADEIESLSDHQTVHYTNDHTYYLHSFGVDGGKATLCPNCSKGETKNGVLGTRPKYSLSKGFDYGFEAVSELPELTFIEKLLVSLNVVQMSLFKIKPKTNSIDVAGCYTAIKGHCIAFPHNGAQEIARCMPRRTIKDVMTILFIGNTVP